MDLDLIARTSAILLTAWSVAATLRRAAPSTRHLVWHLAIVIVLLAPAIMALAPTITVPGVPGVPGVPRVPVASFERGASVPGPLVTVTAPAILGTQQNNALGTPGTVGTLGTLGTLVWFLLCWCLSGLSVWRGSRPAPEQWVHEARSIGRKIGLKEDVRVRQLLREASPHVAGLFRSVVMMPPSASTWTIEARQAALVHELTHIKRHDRRTQAVAQLACAIYWFNPLVWYAAAGLARERERACDDAVLQFGAKPSEYATLLLDLARATNTWMPATALSMARPSAIEGRLLSILADAVRTPRRSTRWLVSSTIIVVTTGILGAQAAQPMVLPAVPEAKPRPIVRPQLLMAMDDQSAAPSVTGALVEALKDADRGVREEAAMGLAVTPGAEVIEPLLRALEDPDAQVREKAAIGLAFRRDPRIIEPLLAAMEDHDAQVREKVAIALGASGDDRAIAALTGAMKDPDAQVREKAVKGLVLLGFRR
jgi:beta-lactamase regulating signal transducer with metallopeptidase domain